MAATPSVWTVALLEKFSQIYELAKRSIGLRDPYRIDEFEIKTLAQDFTDALVKQQFWLNKAIELLQG